MKFCNFNPQTKQIKWKSYVGTSNSSYLDWYFCDENAEDFPIRDVTKKNKLEPHYEDATFNACKRCNRNLLSGSLSRKEQYVFFFTKYVGSNKKFQNEYFITGYYKISKIAKVPDQKYKTRNAIMASEVKFVKIEDGFNLKRMLETDIHNPRQVKKRLDSGMTNMILNHFKGKENCISNYIRETSMLENKKDGFIHITSRKYS